MEHNEARRERKNSRKDYSQNPQAYSAMQNHMPPPMYHSKNGHPSVPYYAVAMMPEDCAEYGPQMAGFADPSNNYNVSSHHANTGRTVPMAMPAYPQHFIASPAYAMTTNGQHMNHDSTHYKMPFYGYPATGFPAAAPPPHLLHQSGHPLPASSSVHTHSQTIPSSNNNGGPPLEMHVDMMNSMMSSDSTSAKSPLIHNGIHNPSVAGALPLTGPPPPHLPNSNLAYPMPPMFTAAHAHAAAAAAAVAAQPTAYLPTTYHLPAQLPPNAFTSPHMIYFPVSLQPQFYHTAAAPHPNFIPTHLAHTATQSIMQMNSNHDNQSLATPPPSPQQHSPDQHDSMLEAHNHHSHHQNHHLHHEPNEYDPDSDGQAHSLSPLQMNPSEEMHHHQPPQPPHHLNEYIAANGHAYEFQSPIYDSNEDINMNALSAPEHAVADHHPMVMTMNGVDQPTNSYQAEEDQPEEENEEHEVEEEPIEQSPVSAVYETSNSEVLNVSDETAVELSTSQNQATDALRSLSLSTTDSASNLMATNELPAFESSVENEVHENSSITNESNISNGKLILVDLPPPMSETDISTTSNKISCESKKMATRPEPNEKPVANVSTDLTTTTVVSRSWADLFKSRQEKNAAAAKLTNHESIKVNTGDSIAVFNQREADRLSTSATNNNAGTTITNNQSSRKKGSNPNLTVIPVDQDPIARKLGRKLKEYRGKHSLPFLIPRGFTNHGNYCYINATLQALLCCPPFYNLMRELGELTYLFRDHTSTPILDSFARFFSNFVPSEQMIKRIRTGNTITFDDLPRIEPLEPKCIYEVLGRINNECLKGKQEDAEEFLSSLLNALNEEIIQLLAVASTPTGRTDSEGKPLVNGKSDHSLSNGTVLISQKNNSKDNAEVDVARTSENDNLWKEIGARHKVVVRNTKMVNTPITDIFGGLIHTVRTAGKDELHMRQPFFTLQLDIQSDKVRSVEDALRQLTLTESIQDYTCPKTNKHIEASCQSFLEQLPPILILHVKLFSFDKSGGMKKLMKKLEFPMHLEIPRECLLQDRLRHSKSYKLLSVVYHEGTEANKGHFLTDLYHIGTNMWLRCDDSVVSEISAPQLLHPSTNHKTPYLLVYRRWDTLRQKNRV